MITIKVYDEVNYNGGIGVGIDVCGCSYDEAKHIAESVRETIMEQKRRGRNNYDLPHIPNATYEMHTKVTTSATHKVEPKYPEVMAKNIEEIYDYMLEKGMADKKDCEAITSFVKAYHNTDDEIVEETIMQGLVDYLDSNCYLDNLCDDWSEDAKYNCTEDFAEDLISAF